MNLTNQSRGQSIALLRRRLLAGGVDAEELRLLADDPRKGVRDLLRRMERIAEGERREDERLRTLSRHESALWARGVVHIAGVDEAGAGPLAGPVVAAAVILKPGARLRGVDDSKKLSAKARERLEKVIRAEAVAVALGQCSAIEIDENNIFQAGRLAMQRAVMGLRTAPDYLLVDARVVPDVQAPQRAIVHGDAHSMSIAAASIIAKVERDRQLEALAARYPGYGFERHRGYGTAHHLKALRELGPCPEHRQSFAPVREAALRRN